MMAAPGQTCPGNPVPKDADSPSNTVLHATPMVQPAATNVLLNSVCSAAESPMLNTELPLPCCSANSALLMLIG